MNMTFKWHWHTTYSGTEKSACAKPLSEANPKLQKV